MAERVVASKRSARRFTRWLLGEQPEEMEGPHEREGTHHQHSWWQVMCLTGVDYFSTLGYQPGIAALAAGALSPIATLILVLLTLFGALPIYRTVAEQSPHGEGSIAMLEHLLSWWKGKLFVLVLIGFVATDFVITITLSAADATAHIEENPFAPAFLHGQEVLITLVLIAFLGAIFLIGFKEAIGIAVVLVGIYLGLNAIVIGRGLYEIFTHPSVLTDWSTALFRSHGNPLMMVAVAMLLFPRLALGLSGFETGVAVMPLVKGAPGDTSDRPTGRIHNTRKLLASAAIIMSVFLLSSSFVTTLLIPAEEFQDGGEASGRALAYLAHTYLGALFGTAYDLSTIAILWFAGASAMAGLLNIVPRYLPRYGMAPEWARAMRPLVLVFTAVAFAVTIIFRADVEAQGGAYATGVLVLMTSAAIAVTLAVWGRGQRKTAYAFGLITLIFVYTTAVNIVERPDGVKIASFFIGTIIVTSLVSRVYRTTELRVERFEIDPVAQRWLDEAAGRRTLRIVANKRQAGDVPEYEMKEQEQRDTNHIPLDAPVLFLEINVVDASEFTDVMEIKGVQVGRHRVLRAESSTVPNSIAAFLLHLRDTYGKIPHCYFAWSEGNPLLYLLRYVLFGEGDTAPVTREILREAEPDPQRRPVTHVAG
ncbi:MAG TPA: hypothetical protein VLA19_25295 [Herpetosiphonaceae bacterium]|nr:hypothetical protein [Herpetosiphonaceae bacterium]